LKQAIASIDAAAEHTSSWQVMLEYQILRREAEALIKQDKP
jgi:hypothetical protein